jgi:hypothetical protein
MSTSQNMKLKLILYAEKQNQQILSTSKTGPAETVKSNAQLGGSNLEFFPFL